jgi:hypothetical protein
MPHPLPLVVLEAYVRQPLENSYIDRVLFTPVKRYYLQHFCIDKEK